MSLLRTIFAGILMFAASLAWADDAAVKDGFWLKSGLDAWFKFQTAKDQTSAAVTIGWIAGVLSAKEQQSTSVEIQLAIFGMMFKSLRDEKKEVEAQQIVSAFKGTLSLAPKFRVPGGVHGDQIPTILLNYLNAHPKDWQRSALAIVDDALTDSYPDENIRSLSNNASQLGK